MIIYHSWKSKKVTAGRIEQAMWPHAARGPPDWHACITGSYHINNSHKCYRSWTLFDRPTWYCRTISAPSWFSKATSWGGFLITIQPNVQQVLNSFSQIIFLRLWFVHLQFASSSAFILTVRIRNHWSVDTKTWLNLKYGYLYRTAKWITRGALSAQVPMLF